MHSQDPIRTEITKQLIKHFGIRSFIETGAYEGETSRFYSELVDRVYTCESDPERYRKTVELCKTYANILISNIPSPAFLEHIGPASPCLFYLDAHWDDDWPLERELKYIQENHPNSIVIIDDCFVPNPNYVGCFGGLRGLEGHDPSTRLDERWVIQRISGWPVQILYPDYAIPEMKEIGYLILNGLEPIQYGFNQNLKCLTR